MFGSLGPVGEKVARQDIRGESLSALGGILVDSQRVEEDPRLDIASLQTILQLNYFSRSYCSLKQHDISQIFHSPAITLARLSGVFIPK